MEWWRRLDGWETADKCFKLASWLIVLGVVSALAECSGDRFARVVAALLLLVWIIALSSALQKAWRALAGPYLDIGIRLATLRGLLVALAVVTVVGSFYLTVFPKIVDVSAAFIDMVNETNSCRAH